jgi:RNA 2',3'-cyclic 3'-phosphodiesterase
MNPDRTSYERLFFALWPDVSLRQQMVQRLTSIQGVQNQGRLVNPNNLHMTLHFLGNIDVDRIDCFIEQAKSVTLNPFELCLNKAGYFKKPRVLWLGSEDIPVQLIQLQQDLEKALNHCGYISERRKYHPHVTVARKIVKPVAEQSIESIKWSVDEFVLVKSLTHPAGVEYRVRDRFGN